MQTLSSLQYAEIYETIITKIIHQTDLENTQHMPPKYKNPNYQNPFKFVPSNYSPSILKIMEDSKKWSDIFGRVSAETFTARLILNKTIKIRACIFSSNRTNKLRQLISELDSGFMTPKIQNELIAHFCKFKKTYWAFTKLARIWKIRRTPIRIQTDLYMTELEINHPSTFQLIHPNGIYLFSLPNLARIIVDAITNQTGMFLEPLPIKNPYTNNLLSKSALYNIYLSMKLRNIKIPDFLEKFFKCEFNIYEFRRKHETELREFAIEQYAKNASISELLQDVTDMLMLHKMTNVIRVSPEFPPKVLVETMRPFLKLYLQERYSFSSMARKYAGRQVKMELKQFAKKNPDFGTRIPIQFRPPLNFNPFLPNQQYIANKTSYVTSTERHKEYCESWYLKTHVYEEETFENYIETGDSLKTYEIKEEPTPILPSAPIPIYNHNPANSEVIYINRTPENALAILSRIGRMPSAVNNLVMNNYISNTIEPSQNQEESDEDEVINNPPYNDDESELELENEYGEDDGEDSVS